MNTTNPIIPVNNPTINNQAIKNLNIGKTDARPLLAEATSVAKPPLEKDLTKLSHLSSMSRTSSETSFAKTENIAGDGSTNVWKATAGSSDINNTEAAVAEVKDHTAHELEEGIKAGNADKQAKALVKAPEVEEKTSEQQSNNTVDNAWELFTQDKE